MFSAEKIAKEKWFCHTQCFPFLHMLTFLCYCNITLVAWAFLFLNEVEKPIIRYIIDIVRFRNWTVHLVYSLTAALSSSTC
jgi:hypothetical protein